MKNPDVETDRQSAATVVADRRALAARRRATVYRQRRPVAADHGAGAESRSDLVAMSNGGRQSLQT